MKPAEKIVCVELKQGRDRHEHAYYPLPGIPPGEVLKPRHARQIVNILGLDPAQAWIYVWSADEWGYAVYPNTLTRLKREFEWNEEVACE